jgi:hypothetical protein
MYVKYLIIGTVLLTILVSIFTQDPGKFNNSKLGVFISVLSSFSIMLTSYGLVLAAEAIEDSKSLTSVDKTFSLIDRALLLPINKMNEYYDKCPNFVESLWPQKNLFKNKTTGKVDDPACVLDLSFIIFQAFEDHFTAFSYDLTGAVVWICNYLQWASSPILQDEFKELYPNFKKKTIDFANLLFEYVDKGPIDTAEILEQRAHEVINDDRYKKIREMD